LEVRTIGPELGLPEGAAGPYHGSFGEIFKAFKGLATEDLSGIRAPGNCHQPAASHLFRGEVFEGIKRDIDLAGEQGLMELAMSLERAFIVERKSLDLELRFRPVFFEALDQPAGVGQPDQASSCANHDDPHTHLYYWPQGLFAYYEVDLMGLEEDQE
jgi:hypothetical protein